MFGLAELEKYFCTSQDIFGPSRTVLLVCAHARACLDVSMDKILHFTNTFIIINLQAVYQVSSLCACFVTCPVFLGCDLK